MSGEETTAVLALVNDGAEPVAFRGGVREDPCYRVAYRAADQWIERTPSWIECGTGLDDFVLRPGERAELEVGIARPDLPLRVGVGTWTPIDGTRPEWTEWRWTWTEPLVLDGSR